MHKNNSYQFTCTNIFKYKKFVLKNYKARNSYDQIYKKIKNKKR